MKKIFSFLFSTKLMAVLFLVFAGAMAVATFIENDFGTPTARVLVYNAWWFEAIMALFVVNFIGNIFKFKLFRPKKIVTLVFHLSFILILVGAFVTRYISYEGMVVIKEGEKTNTLLTQNTFLQIHIDNSEEQIEFDKKLEFSKIAPDFFNKFNVKTNFRKQDVELKYVDFIPQAETIFEEEENGEKYLHFVESSAGSRADHYIKDGEYKTINRTTVGFNTDTKQGINIIEAGDRFMIKTNEDGSFYRMRDKFQGMVYSDSVQDLNLLSLYTLQGLQFVVPTLAVEGKFETKSGSGVLDQLVIDVTAKDEQGVKHTQRIKLKGGKYLIDAPQFFSLAGLNFRLNYGSKIKEMPFVVKLRDFQLETYPGSESPKSYASEVTVIDQDNRFDFKIFMNNILDYKGFRLFQSSYNITPEYEETRLSVNHDYWGTLITYIGYTLLYIGLLLILFVPGSRFTNLKKMLDKVKEKKAALMLVFVLMTSMSIAQHNQKNFSLNTDSLIAENMAPKAQADAFGKLVIQDVKGRMLPFNTFSSQLLRKVSKKDTYKGYTADQVSLSMIINPRVWYVAPIIYLEKGHDKLRDLLDLPHEQKYASLIDFFDPKGNYKLKEEVSKAHKEQIKSKFQKDLINVDKRFNLLYSAVDGALFRFFPKPNDENQAWYTAQDAQRAGFTGMDSTVVASILKLYSMEFDQAKKTGNYSQLDQIVLGISKFQKQYGGSIMPTEDQINFEILYNKFDVFKSLFVYFMLAGMLLMILALIQIFKDSKIVRILINVNVAVIVILFLLHTAGLGVRWYIAGHAPWSNAYESMIYISWATMFFGLGIGRKSILTIASTAFVTAMMLMIAHWNWMDPAIENLVPVLNSYWLMIHVAIIVASYGPFAVGMITAFMSLVLMTAITKSNKTIMKLNIDELTIITELALTMGVILLTIGNFLGGQWANESWGRYWGWDPKETWALISIMIYAFVIHARFVPALKSKWIFNVMATFAFTSVLMTYLGVNHLLSGLHSYAAGEKAAIPNQIWFSLAVATIVSIIALFKYKKHYK